MLHCRHLADAFVAGIRDAKLISIEKKKGEEVYKFKIACPFIHDELVEELACGYLTSKSIEAEFSALTAEFIDQKIKYFLTLIVTHAHKTFIDCSLVVMGPA